MKSARRYNALLVSSAVAVVASFLEFGVLLFVATENAAVMAAYTLLFGLPLASVSWLFGYSLLIPMGWKLRTLLASIGWLVLLLDATVVVGVVVEIPDELRARSRFVAIV